MKILDFLRVSYEIETLKDGLTKVTFLVENASRILYLPSSPQLRSILAAST